MASKIIASLCLGKRDKGTKEWGTHHEGLQMKSRDTHFWSLGPVGYSNYSFLDTLYLHHCYSWGNICPLAGQFATPLSQWMDQRGVDVLHQDLLS